MSGFNNSIVGGAGTLIRESIHSPDYVAGVSGWTINRDGSAEFNNITFRGTLISVDPTTGQMIKIQAGTIILDNDTVNATVFATAAGLQLFSNEGVTVSCSDGPIVLTGTEVDVHTAFSAANIIAGHVLITPVPNTPTSAHITFTMPGNVTTAYGFATAKTAVPGTTVLGVGIANVTTSSADIYITRTNNTATDVFYLLIGA